MVIKSCVLYIFNILLCRYFLAPLVDCNGSEYDDNDVFVMVTMRVMMKMMKGIIVLMAVVIMMTITMLTAMVRMMMM